MDWSPELESFQMGFFACESRFPAMVAGWGTGKTMTAILKAVDLSFRYPGNQGLILRKNFTDLKDSTMADFVRYTKNQYRIKVQSKSVEIPVQDKDGKFLGTSKILFHHADELAGVIQNINLGWFFIEQAEEFDSEEVFMMLRGRLRREDCLRQGFIIANTNGHNWIWRLWKSDPKDEFELFEAKTHDNSVNLPDDFLKDLNSMAEQSPSHYRRFVLNSWEDTDTADRVIPYQKILDAVGRDLRDYDDSLTILGCDIAEFGNDKTVVYVLRGCGVTDQMIKTKRPHMETAGEIFALYKEHFADLIGIDDIGEGAGVRSELRRLISPGDESRMADQSIEAVDMNKWSVVRSIKAGRAATHETKFARLRDEMWWNAKELFEGDYVSIPDDPQLIEELAAHTYWENAKHQPIIVRKKDVKKTLGWSPDKADALVMGLWLAKKGPQKIPALAGPQQQQGGEYDVLRFGL